MSRPKRIGGYNFNWFIERYDSVLHDPLIAELECYGTDKIRFSLTLDYLSCHKQRYSSSYSSWSDIVRGAPQGSFLGRLLFNLFVNELFFVITEVCTDDNTLYNPNKELETVFKNLKIDLNNAWVGLR